MTTRLRALLAVLGLSLASQASTGELQSVVSKGLRIDFSIGSSDQAGEATAARSLTEGQYAEVRFRVTDAGTGAPVSPLKPAVWVGRTTGSEAMSCREQISGYLQGMLATQADVDLNKYFILVLNDDRGISVIDPMLGVSGSHAALHHGPAREARRGLGTQPGRPASVRHHAGGRQGRGRRRKPQEP